jgi:hypothetical protein
MRSFSYKFLLKSLIAAILAYIIFYHFIMPVHNAIKFKHKNIFYNYKQYLWLFNDSIQKKLIMSDSLLSSSGAERSSDSYYDYILESNTYVGIWELKDLTQIYVSNIKFIFDPDLPAFNKVGVEIFNQDINALPTIVIKYELPFQNSLEANFIRPHDIKVIRDTVNCKAFYGKITKLSIGNKQNEQLALFDFKKISQTLIIFYKHESRLFIIWIVSEHTIDQDAIKIFNLK